MMTNKQIEIMLLADKLDVQVAYLSIEVRRTNDRNYKNAINSRYEKIKLIMAELKKLEIGENVL